MDERSWRLHACSDRRLGRALVFGRVRRQLIVDHRERLQLLLLELQDFLILLSGLS